MAYDSIAIGNRAYAARKNKNLKQNDISSVLGIHQATYSKFELGQYDMPLSQVIKLCDLLDVSMTWLIGEDIITDLSDSERLLVEHFIRYIKNIRKK